MLIAQTAIFPSEASTTAARVDLLFYFLLSVCGAVGLLVAFLLFKNDVIKEDEVMDQQSLPKVKMPNANGAAMPPEPYKPGQPRLQGYP